MSFLNKTSDDLIESLEGGEAAVIYLGFSGLFIVSIMRFADGHIEIWKVTP